MTTYVDRNGVCPGKRFVDFFSCGLQILLKTKARIVFLSVMILCCCFAIVTASAHMDASGACNFVAVHLVTDPELDEATEQNVAEAITRAAEIVDQLKDTSPEVKSLMRKLKTNVTKDRQSVIKRKLRHEFEVALKQAGISQEVWIPFASFAAKSTVKDMHFVVAKPEASIVVYFRCDTVKTVDELHKMVTSGFMPRVFLEIIKFFIRTSVALYIYITSNELGVPILAFTSDRGLLFDRLLLTLKVTGHFRPERVQHYIDGSDLSRQFGTRSDLSVELSSPKCRSVCGFLLHIFADCGIAFTTVS